MSFPPPIDFEIKKPALLRTGFYHIRAFPGGDQHLLATNVGAADDYSETSVFTVSRATGHHKIKWFVEVGGDQLVIYLDEGKRQGVGYKKDARGEPLYILKTPARWKYALVEGKLNLYTLTTPLGKHRMHAHDKYKAFDAPGGLGTQTTGGDPNTSEEKIEGVTLEDPFPTPHQRWEFLEADRQAPKIDPSFLPNFYHIRSFAHARQHLMVEETSLELDATDNVVTVLKADSKPTKWFVVADLNTKLLRIFLDETQNPGVAYNKDDKEEKLVIGAEAGVFRYTLVEGTINMYTLETPRNYLVDAHKKPVPGPSPATREEVTLQQAQQDAPNQIWEFLKVGA